MSDKGLQARDAFMARLASARASSQAALDAIDEAIALCVDPSEDDDGEEREDLVDAAIEAAGCTSRALEAASDVIEDIDAAAGEPWDDAAPEPEPEPKKKRSRR